jgi:hypothetical protein
MGIYKKEGSKRENRLQYARERGEQGRTDRNI